MKNLDQDFMTVLEYTPGGLLSDFAYSYDRPARVTRDPRTGLLEAEIGHDATANFVGKYVRYKNQVMVVTHVKLQTGKPPKITAEPVPVYRR